MQFYDYIYRESIVHRLDPRVKLLWLLGLSFLVFIVESNAVVSALFLFTVATIGFAKLPVKAVWNSTKLFIVLFTLAYMVLFSLLLWDWQRGMTDGFFFSLKFLVLIIASVVFAMSTSPRDLLLSLTKLKVPFEFAFMLTLAIRFVPVIMREVNHVRDAQKARAHKFAFSLKHPRKSVESSLPVLIPTFHLLLMKAFNLSLSIEARAFRAKKHRTFPPRLKLKFGDYLASLILVVLFVWIV